MFLIIALTTVPSVSSNFVSEFVGCRNGIVVVMGYKASYFGHKAVGKEGRNRQFGVCWIR